MTDDIDEIVRHLRDSWNSGSVELRAADALERLETECNDWEARFWVERARADKADQAINIIVNEFSVMKDRAEAAESDYRTVCEGLVQCHRERAQAEARAEAAEKELKELKSERKNSNRW